MKKSLRSFGLAFFLIGAFLTIVQQFPLNIPYISMEGENQSSEKYKKQITKLETELKEAQEQLKQLEKQGSTNDHDVENEPLETSMEASTKEDEIVHGTLQIYSGITPYVIGQKLEDLGIVKNALEVELYLARPEYSRSIQIGEFDLHSDMSIEEIAKIITGKVQKKIN